MRCRCNLPDTEFFFAFGFSSRQPLVDKVLPAKLIVTGCDCLGEYLVWADLQRPPPFDGQGLDKVHHLLSREWFERVWNRLEYHYPYCAHLDEFVEPGGIHSSIRIKIMTVLLNHSYYFLYNLQVELGR